MRRSYFPHFRTVFLVVLMVGSFIGISLQVRDPAGTTFFARGAMAALAPAQAGVSACARTIDGVWEGYLALAGVRTENQGLRREVDSLRCEIALLREEIARAGRTEEFLRFQREASLTGVVARVTGESPDPWTKAISLEAGSASGVRRGMPVVTPRGVVGRIHQVSEGSSLATLVTDRSSAVPVLVGASRSRAILEGENAGTCALKYLERAAQVEVGDQVISSGLGGVFPPGLPVGTVSQVLKKGAGLYQYAKVVPSVHLDRLEEVMVLTTPRAGDAP